MFNYIDYWETRYKRGSNSGGGSYGESAKLKGDYVTNIINIYGIKTINDHGHGDCNQLKYITGYEKYTGYDISETIRKKCIELYSDVNNIFIDSIDKFEECDLSLSLDVLYHIVDYNDFVNYIHNLFDKTKYVIIYGMDIDMENDPHVVSRQFTDYIENNINNFSLVSVEAGMLEKVKFYFYKRNDL